MAAELVKCIEVTSAWAADVAEAIAADVADATAEETTPGIDSEADISG